VLEAADGLHSMGMMSVGLLVRKKQVLDGTITYFHGRSFHRVSEPQQSGVEVRPSDCTTLLAEVTCKPSDTVWSQPSELCAQIVRELAAEGVAQPEEIVEQHVFRTEDAYPVYRVGFETKIAAVKADLDTIRDLVSTGRQGRFDFMTAATAMKMARADVLAGLARLDA
jgi:protoporphyrinogen oxidase